MVKDGLIRDMASPKCVPMKLPKSAIISGYPKWVPANALAGAQNGYLQTLAGAQNGYPNIKELLT